MVSHSLTIWMPFRTHSSRHFSCSVGFGSRINERCTAGIRSFCRQLFFVRSIICCTSGRLRSSSVTRGTLLRPPNKRVKSNCGSCCPLICGSAILHCIQMPLASASSESNVLCMILRFNLLLADFAAFAFILYLLLADNVTLTSFSTST